ncbi:MAG TPA: hypothetical protein VGO55_05755 [Allosphingosinicella sp.]|jgi:hypothetical protein|nr:hypothetical protein [Allosphingosinicella sp.]
MFELHLQRGTGKAALFGSSATMEWTNEEFIIAMSGNRSKEKELSRNTLDSWRHGRSFPGGEHRIALFKVFWPRRLRDNRPEFDAFRDALATAKEERKYLARRRRADGPGSLGDVPAPLSELLDRIGVDPTDFRASLHPPQIGEVIDDYLRRWPDLLPISQARDFVFRVSDYPSVYKESLQQGYAQFYAYLHEIEASFPEIGEMSYVNTQFVGARLEDSSLPLLKKVLVPFLYRSATRRAAWGVIPIGVQQAFGILLPRSVFEAAFAGISPNALNACHQSASAPDLLALSLTEFGATYAAELDLLGGHWTFDGTTSFLRQLVRYMLGAAGSLYVRAGYVQGDMLSARLARAGLTDLASQAQEALAIASGNDEADFPIFRREAASLREPPKPSMSPAGVLFDLGQIDRVLAGAASGLPANTRLGDAFIGIVIRHDLSIPAGIGFSIPVLPFLLKRHTWTAGGSPQFLYEALDHAAREIYHSADSFGEEAFRRIGTVLTAV